MRSPTTATPLELFLRQPDIETSPAWEFINGQAQQKPMPTLFHSRLQRNLVNAVRLIYKAKFCIVWAMELSWPG